VVHDVRRRCLQNAKRPIEPASKVRHKNLNLSLRRVLPNRPNALYKMRGPAIAEIVSVDTGDDHIAQAQRSDSLGKVHWLLCVERIWAPMSDIAEGAATGAFISHDHESGRALAKALSNIWA